MGLLSLLERKKLHAIKALKILAEAGYESRLAGGCVRDMLLGATPQDFDIATVALPEQMLKAFAKEGIKTIPTGIDHGTITVVMKSGPIEITTLRKDERTDGRHAQVSFVDDFQIDASRRDFTINAMFEDMSGRIYDYFSGQEDLKNRRLRFVGDAKKRIQEDYLRIMRYFRFQARFSLKANQDELDAIKENAHGLKQISQERITAELIKLLQCDLVGSVLTEMIQCKILPYAIPSLSTLDNETIAALDKLQTIEKSDRAMARLALILSHKNDSKALQQIAHNLKLTKKQTALVLFLSQAPKHLSQLKSDDNAAAMAFIDHAEDACGEGSFFPLVASYMQQMPLSPQLKTLLNFAKKTENTKAHIRKARLPLTGDDLINRLQIKKGPEIGQILNRLKEEFRNEKWSTKDEAIAIAHNLISE
ncbi:MAG: CCA tRNA nucleotidyltransferase [Bdellovibrionota bacterium]